MTTHTYTVPTEPIGKGRPRMTRNGHAYTPGATRQAETTVRLAVAAMHGAGPLAGPLAVSLLFRLTRPKSTKRALPAVRPDLDNLCKLTLDALNGVLWDDDAQIVRLAASKVYGEPAGTDITVEAAQ